MDGIERLVEYSLLLLLLEAIFVLFFSDMLCFILNFYWKDMKNGLLTNAYLTAVPICDLKRNTERG